MNKKWNYFYAFLKQDARDLEDILSETLKDGDEMRARGALEQVRFLIHFMDGVAKMTDEEVEWGLDDLREREG